MEGRVFSVVYLGFFGTISHLAQASLDMPEPEDALMLLILLPPLPKSWN